MFAQPYVAPESLLGGAATQGTSIPQKPFCKAPGQSVFHGGGEVVEHIQWLADSRNLGS